jgi:hypothetical protein
MDRYQKGINASDELRGEAVLRLNDLAFRHREARH